MLLRIGWKNIWRNKTRSLVVIVAVMLGIFGGVMSAGIMQGWIEQRIHSSIYNEIAHVQIHDSAYIKNEEIQHTIKDYDRVAGILDTMEGVTAWSPRVKIYAMAQTANHIGGFIVRGVDPEKEKKVCEIYKHIDAGSFLEEDSLVPSIVIGSKAAEEFKLINYQITDEKLRGIEKDKRYNDKLISKLRKAEQGNDTRKKDFSTRLKQILGDKDFEKYGDDLIRDFAYYKLERRIFVSLPDKNTGVTVPYKFKVRGIYDTDNDMWDGLNAYIDREVMDSYTNLANNEVHEIAIISTDTKKADKIAKKLQDDYMPEQHVMSWREIDPLTGIYTDFSMLMAYIFVTIILFALAFGIINTMMMAVLERIKELGMLMAIGMNKKRVFGMIMLESVFLTLTGAVVGMIFSGIVLTILAKTGLNFEMFSEGFEAIGYATLVYPKISLLNYLIITLLVVITGIVAAIWPARKALKLNPVEALRTE